MVVFINYQGKRKSKQVGARKSAFEVKRLLQAKLTLGDLTFDAEYIFTNKGGNPVDPNTWRQREFKKAPEKAGLRQIRIHDLRHACVTMRIAMGDNIAEVSIQLDNCCVKPSLDTYYHWMQVKNKSEIDGLSDMLLYAPHYP